MTNKELIQKLVEYFLTQDPKIIARLLANQMIDMNRLLIQDSLPQEEAASLTLRLILNSLELERFRKEGPKGNLTLGELDDHYTH